MRQRWLRPLPATQSCWAVLPQFFMHATPSNNAGMGDGHRYMVLTGVAMRPQGVNALLVNTVCAISLALHHKVDGAGLTPLWMLDMGTGSNCLIYLLFWRLWAVGVAVFGVGVDIDCVSITSANTKRMILSMPVAKDCHTHCPEPPE